MTSRTPDQYYLYFTKDDGDSMVLTRFWTGSDGINRFIWTPHLCVAAWNMPLFFPTPEQAEVVIEDYEFNFLGEAAVQIGRWISMTNCHRNDHVPGE